MMISCVHTTAVVPALMYTLPCATYNARINRVAGPPSTTYAIRGVPQTHHVS